MDIEMLVLNKNYQTKIASYFVINVHTNVDPIT